MTGDGCSLREWKETRACERWEADAIAFLEAREVRAQQRAAERARRQRYEGLGEPRRRRNLYTNERRRRRCTGAQKSRGAREWTARVSTVADSFEISANIHTNHSILSAYTHNPTLNPCPQHLSTLFSISQASLAPVRSHTFLSAHAHAHPDSPSPPHPQNTKTKRVPVELLFSINLLAALLLALSTRRLGRRRLHHPLR